MMREAVTLARTDFRERISLAFWIKTGLFTWRKSGDGFPVVFLQLAIIPGCKINEHGVQSAAVKPTPIYDYTGNSPGVLNVV
jgi:hypothetical protein